MKILILNVEDYDFINNDNEEVKGSNVYYMIENEAKILKLSLNKYSKNESLRNKIVSYPALYDSLMKSVVKKDNLVMVIDDLDFIEEVNIFKNE